MEKRLNIPNSLSLLRLLLFPVIFLLIIRSNRDNYPFLILVFFLAIALDFFDGFLARKLKQQTELGKILDPVADKVMVFFVVLGLMIKSDFPIWLGAIIILRDVVILCVAGMMMKKRHIVTPSILIGKITFALFGALILVYLLDLHQDLNLDILKRFFVVITTGFIAWSGVEYFIVYKTDGESLSVRGE